MHLNMSYSEVRSLPVRYRHWYMDRLLKHFREKNERVNNKNNTHDSENMKNPTAEELIFSVNSNEIFSSISTSPISIVET